MRTVFVQGGEEERICGGSRDSMGERDLRGIDAAEPPATRFLRAEVEGGTGAEFGGEGD